MQIQINSENNIKISQEHIDRFKEIISAALDRYSDQITRVEAHLSDENSRKKGPDDKRCLLEARLEGLQPVAASNIASTLELAVSGAAGKLKQSLASIKGRLRNY
jgi:ribosome-associated translation inhibitor RaiA